ncbi:MAG: 30S ribosome-binding factor RbfA [Chloroflexi bacterium]|nr:30S ribosome-binding factor RbfA [Chloroflexota bacterium]
MNRRTERVSGLLHEELGRLLLEGLHDPRLGQMVTVTKVDISSDLLFATVLVTVLGSADDAREAMEGLRSATGFLRRELAQRLKLKRTPELRFALDGSIEEGDRVLALLDSIKDQETTTDG